MHSTHSTNPLRAASGWRQVRATPIGAHVCRAVAGRGPYDLLSTQGPRRVRWRASRPAPWRSSLQEIAAAGGPAAADYEVLDERGATFTPGKPPAALHVHASVQQAWQLPMLLAAGARFLRLSQLVARCALRHRCCCTRRACLLQGGEHAGQGPGGAGGGGAPKAGGPPARARRDGRLRSQGRQVPAAGEASSGPLAGHVCLCPLAGAARRARKAHTCRPLRLCRRLRRPAALRPSPFAGWCRRGVLQRLQRSQPPRPGLQPVPLAACAAQQRAAAAAGGSPS